MQWVGHERGYTPNGNANSASKSSEVESERDSEGVNEASEALRKSCELNGAEALILQMHDRITFERIWPIRCSRYPASNRYSRLIALVVTR